MTDLITFTPEQTVAMREAWISSGYSATDFDAAVAPPPAAAPAVQAPAGAADAAFQVADDIPAVPILEPAQLLELAEAMKAAGVSEAEIAEAMRADGLQPLAADTRTDEQKDFDRAFAPALPHEYKVDWYGRIPADMDADTAAAANAEWQRFCADVGFPPSIGSAFVEIAVDRGQWLTRADEPTRALWLKEQEVRIEQLAGGEDKVDAFLDRAIAALARGGPALMEALDRSSVLYDAELLAHLANHGERLAWRAGKGPED